MKLINDVKRVGRDRLMDAIDDEKVHQAQVQNEMERSIMEADDSVLIAELYNRGVKFSTIFAQYYEMEVQGEQTDQLMEVGDVELAGLDGNNFDATKGF